MVAKIYTIAVLGLAGHLVEVEVHVSNGLHRFDVVGLPSKSVQEAKLRVRSAIINCGYHFPTTVITVNLAPADLGKIGTAYDLPIAVGILVATGQLAISIENCVFWGELALNGNLRNTRGALIVADACRAIVKNRLVLPEINAQEAEIVAGINLGKVANLAQLSENLSLKLTSGINVNLCGETAGKTVAIDLADIKGQFKAKRALEIAAAGGHNLLFTGVAGSGKSYLSKCLPTILPNLTTEQAIEVTKIYSCAGLVEGAILV